jgi:protein TonB
MAGNIVIPTVLSHPEVRRWAGSAVCALLLHAGVAAALLWDFDFGEPAPVAQPLAALTVQLAALPTSPKRQVTQVAPGPDQVQQKVQPKPQPKKVRFDPPPETHEPPPPDALATKVDQPQPDQRLAAEHTTAAQASDAKPDESLTAPVESTPTDQASNASETWESKLLAHLEHFKRYPDAAQRGHQEDVVYLRFTMDRSGKVLQWNIERSRGYSLLDSEVRELIQRASPLPPPPDEVTGSNIEMVVPVEFFVRRTAQMTRR